MGAEADASASEPSELSAEGHKRAVGGRTGWKAKGWEGRDHGADVLTPPPPHPTPPYPFAEKQENTTNKTNNTNTNT